MGTQLATVIKAYDVKDDNDDERKKLNNNY